MTKMLVLDRDVSRQLIRQRKRLRQDRYDEVWDGFYIMPTLPNLDHQELVLDLSGVYKSVVKPEGGSVYPGANVSDRPKNWKENYRCPDSVVLLKNSRAKKRDTHIFGGPDFLTEIRSPDEDPTEKIPFYSKIQARELLIMDRDTRELTLLRHEGAQLVEGEATTFQGERWLVSEVLPLAFRRIVQKGKPRTEIRRTDGTAGHWIL